MCQQHMRRFWGFLKAHYRAYDLLPDYLHSIKYAGWDVIWAPLLPSIVYWLLWFRPNPPSWWITLIYALWVVIVSGYFVWRPYRVRLTPKLELNIPLIIDTPTNVGQLNRRFVQIPATCLTQTRLENCGGQLLRVWKWVNDDWQLTQVDEPLDLNWSILDAPTTFLEQDVVRRLNVFFVENTNRYINSASNRVPFRMALSSAPSDVFRFDVRIGAADVAPEYISFKVTFGQHWDDIQVQKL